MADNDWFAMATSTNKKKSQDPSNEPKIGGTRKLTESTELDMRKIEFSKKKKV